MAAAVPAHLGVAEREKWKAACEPATAPYFKRWDWVFAGVPAPFWQHSASGHTSYTPPVLNDHLRAEHAAMKANLGHVFSCELARSLLVFLPNDRYQVVPVGTVVPPHEIHTTGRQLAMICDDRDGLEVTIDWNNLYMARCASSLPASAYSCIITVFDSDDARDAPLLPKCKLYPVTAQACFIFTMTEPKVLAGATHERFEAVRTDLAFVLHAQGILQRPSENECDYHANEAALRGLHYSHIPIVTRKGKQARVGSGAGGDGDDDDHDDDDDVDLT